MLLQKTTVVRGGATARHWTSETTRVNVQATKSLNVKTSIASKGGGTTEIEIRVGASDFGAIIKSMVVADRQAALAAMATELARQIDAQPQIDDAVRKSARNEVSSAALDAFYGAPANNDSSELAISEAVSEIVNNLNKSSVVAN